MNIRLRLDLWYSLTKRKITRKLRLYFFRQPKRDSEGKFARAGG